VCVCVYIYIYIYTYIHTHTHTNKQTTGMVRKPQNKTKNVKGTDSAEFLCGEVNYGAHN